MSDLSENEKLLIDAIQHNNVEDVKQLLNENDVRINCCDDNGMTGLQHSAFKGYEDICRYLIEMGANVNHKQPVQGYTAIMFAALGGHRPVVELLLDSGAQTDTINAVNRNAAQMCAFVGQHQMVAIINNFISREDVEYYTRKHGLENEPKLTGRMVPYVLELVRQTNIHPIRVGLLIKSNWLLMERADKVIKVLQMMCEKQLKDKLNEMISFKLHYLAFVLNHLHHDIKPDNNAIKEDNIKRLEKLMKKWLIMRDNEDFPVYLEQLVREAIRQYPYHECALFQQMIQTLSTVQIGSEPSALSILSRAINGQKGFGDEESLVCGTCGQFNPKSQCSRCKQIQYCNQDCQRLHWMHHKKLCITTTTTSLDN